MVVAQVHGHSSAAAERMQSTNGQYSGSHVVVVRVAEELIVPVVTVSVVVAMDVVVVDVIVELVSERVVKVPVVFVVAVSGHEHVHIICASGS